VSALPDLPLPAIELLRRARSALLHAAGPVERLFSAPSRALPPLWLRRHAGPVANFVSSALAAERLLDELGLLRAGASVVDLGCGPGAMAPVFARHLGPGGRYLGLDVHEPSIRWCRRQWAVDPRFRFELLDRESPYRTTRGGRRGGLPVAPGSVDLVIAKSVFTHVLAEECADLLAEIRRVLAPERGRALVTAFLFDGRRDGGLPPYFPHPDPKAAVRWRYRRWPHAAVAYERGLFDFLARANGLVCERFLAGFFPGTAAEPSGQDVLVLAPEGEPLARGAG
jgi:SAM-dependent methyltransferase